MFFHLPKVFVTRIIVNIILLRYINKNMIIQILMSIIYMIIEQDTKNNYYNNMY